MQCQCALFCTLENGPQAAEDVLWLKRQPPVLFHGNNVGHRIIITISLSFRPTNNNSHNVNLQPFYAAYSYLIAWRYASGHVPIFTPPREMWQLGDVTGVWRWWDVSIPHYTDKTNVTINVPLGRLSGSLATPLMLRSLILTALLSLVRRHFIISSINSISSWAISSSHK